MQINSQPFYQAIKDRLQHLDAKGAAKMLVRYQLEGSRPQPYVLIRAGENNGGQVYQFKAHPNPEFGITQEFGVTMLERMFRYVDRSMARIISEDVEERGYEDGAACHLEIVLTPSDYTGQEPELEWNRVATVHVPRGFSAGHFDKANPAVFQ